MLSTLCPLAPHQVEVSGLVGLEDSGGRSFLPGGLVPPSVMMPSLEPLSHLLALWLGWKKQGWLH